MTKTSPLSADIIDAVFRPAIGFFVGIALGYLVQLAGTTGVLPAIIYGTILIVIALLYLRLYDRLWAASDWVFEKLGIAPAPRKQLAPIPKQRKHWFVRFGWIGAMTTAFFITMIWPETVQSWL